MRVVGLSDAHHPRCDGWHTDEPGYDFNRWYFDVADDLRYEVIIPMCWWDSGSEARATEAFQRLSGLELCLVRGSKHCQEDDEVINAEGFPPLRIVFHGSFSREYALESDVKLRRDAVEAIRLAEVCIGCDETRSQKPNVGCGWYLHGWRDSWVCSQECVYRYIDKLRAVEKEKQCLKAVRKSLGKLAASSKLRGQERLDALQSLKADLRPLARSRGSCRPSSPI